MQIFPDFRTDNNKKHFTCAYFKAKIDETSDPTYYGYISSRGYAWVIEKVDYSSGDVTYSVGTSDLDTNWTNRASLTYQSINDWVMA